MHVHVHSQLCAGLAISAFKELAAFVLDKDTDDDDWGKSQITRQGLLQDLGILDVIVKVLSEPLAAFSDNELTNDTLKELQVGTAEVVVWLAWACTCVGMR